MNSVFDIGPPLVLRRIAHFFLIYKVGADEALTIDISSSSEQYKTRVQLRLAQAKEKLEFWQKQLFEAESLITEKGGQIISPETIKVGDEIYYLGWLPVVRVNKKTVTVSNWLNVKSFQYKIPYTKIQRFRAVVKNS